MKPIDLDDIFNEMEEEKQYLADLREIVELIVEYAEMGNSEAQYALGVCYLEGHGVKPNKEVAEEWIALAAQAGHPYALQYQRSGYLETVDFMTIENEIYEEAERSERVEYLIDLFHQAANRGNKIAQHALAVCYYLGVGVPEDRQEAYAWLRQAADLGNGDSILALQNERLISKVNFATIEADIEFEDEAMELEQKALVAIENAAQWGNRVALFALGVCYLDGRGVDVDRDYGISLIEMSAERGYPPAIESAKSNFTRYSEVDFAEIIGEIEEEDERVKRLGEQIERVEQAASEGNRVGKYVYGVCCLTGLGVDMDEYAGTSLIEMSAKHGYQPAIEMIKTNFSDRPQFDFERVIAEIEAEDERMEQLSAKIERLEVAAREGNRIAQYALGICYLEGEGVERDELLGMDLLSLSAEQGYQPAIARLEGDKPTQLKTTQD